MTNYNYLPVRNQKGSNMCCAFSLATILEHKYKLNRYISPEYIYSKRKNKNINKGITLEEGLDILLNYGSCLDKYWKFDSRKHLCFHHKKIDFYKISDFGPCYSVYEAIYYLDNVGPIPFTTYYYEPEDRKDLAKSWISKYYLEESGSGSGSGSNSNNMDQEAHCMLFTGYNNYSFICRNSWGPDFGNNGYIEFPFEDFKYILDIYWVK